MKYLLLFLLAAFGATAQSTYIGNPDPLFNTIRNGVGAPSSLIGNDGDFYIDTTSGAQMLYGPKFAGVWGTGTSIVGSTGSACTPATASNLGCVLLPANSGLSVDSSGNLVVSLAFTAPLARTGPTVTINQATSTTDGYLSHTDWGTFNAKLSSLPTVGTAGTCGDSTHWCIPVVDAYGRISSYTTQVAPTGSGSSGLPDPGSNGIVVRTALNTTTAVAAPFGAVVGTTDTQTLTNKTVDGITPTTFSYVDLTSSAQTQLNSKQATLSFTGTGSKTVSATAAGNSGHCAQWTSAGDIGDAGSACGSGGGGTTSPGGSSGQIEYNNGGTFGGLPAPSGTIIGTTDTQTLTNKSISATEVNSGTLGGSQMPAFTGDVSTSSGSTATTLASANTSGAGSYGDSTHTVTLTVDAKGRITAISTNAISGGGGGGSSDVTIGTLSAIPSTCSAGALYFATDQPAGQQLYGCSSTNTWSEFNALGPSGALAYTGGYLDIVTSVLPRLTAANTFLGLNAFANGIQLTTLASAEPTCSGSSPGLLWYNGTSGGAAESVQACLWNGSAYVWTSLASSGGGSYTLPGTVAQTNQANTYTAGDKQEFAAGATNAGAGFAGVSADPSALTAGDLWYRTDLTHLSTYNGSVQRLMYQSDSVAAAQMPALTGDATTTAGAVATTLATVMSAPGTYGDAAHSLQLTVDAKGRSTGIATNAIGITHAAVSDFASAAAADAPVQSVAGRTGAVTLAVADVTNAASTAASNTFGAYSQYFGGNVYAGSGDCYYFGSTGTGHGICDAGSGAINLIGGSAASRSIQIGGTGGITFYAAPVGYANATLGASGYPWGATYTGVVIGGSSAPSIAAGTGAGTSPTVAMVSGATNLSGYFTVTTGTSPATSATVATVTFSTTVTTEEYTVAPKCFAWPANAATQALTGSGAAQIFPANTVAASFQLSQGSTALTASTAYEWGYSCTQ